MTVHDEYELEESLKGLKLVDGGTVFMEVALEDGSPIPIPQIEAFVRARLYRWDCQLRIGLGGPVFHFLVGYIDEASPVYIGVLVSDPGIVKFRWVCYHDGLEYTEAIELHIPTLLRTAGEPDCPVEETVPLYINSLRLLLTCLAGRASEVVELGDGEV